jgi:hypothetical protein
MDDRRAPFRGAPGGEHSFKRRSVLQVLLAGGDSVRLRSTGAKLLLLLWVDVALPFRMLSCQRWESIVEQRLRIDASAGTKREHGAVFRKTMVRAPRLAKIKFCNRP